MSTTTNSTDRNIQAEPVTAVMWDDLDVAVVGGGPAGLAVALALKTVRPNLNLKVFEASTAYTRQGAGVGVVTNGIRALEAINPLVLHRMLQDSFVSCAFYQYSDETGERMPWVQGFDPRKNFQAFQAPWNTLRRELYAGLPQDIVEFGCKVMGCSESAATTGDGNSGHSASSPAAREGEGDQPDAEPGRRYTLKISRTEPGGPEDAGPQEVLARARYVIAADGYFSRIRRMAGDGQTPVFQGTVRWLGTFTQEELGGVPLPVVLADETTAPSLHAWLPIAADRPMENRPTRSLLLYATGGDRSGTARMLVWSLATDVKVLTAAGEVFPMPPAGEGWAQNSGGGSAGRSDGDGATDMLSAQDNTGTAGHKQGARALQRALAVSTHMPADVRAMLAATPPERVMEFGVYIHPGETFQPGAWARSGLLLLGDAAHAARPDGQGANQSFEDAVVLAALVRQHGLGPKTFTMWEESRQARARDILHDPTPGASIRMSLINASSFEPLWCPVELSAPGGPLPEPVAAEVREALATGGIDKGREAILAWSRAEMQRMVAEKVGDRPIPETVPPPANTFRFR